MMEPAQSMGGATAPVRPFIEVFEVWTPDDKGERLTLATGVYGEKTAFAEKSAGMSFAKGEGLPGKAWSDGAPVVLNGFQGTFFVRTEAAAESGLTTAIAIPAIQNGKLTGVLVLFCSDLDSRSGAIEVWREDPSQDGVLVLDDGYYGAAEHFEWVSRRTQFPRGQGLPGAVWASAAAMLLRDLGSSYRFVRAESAGRAGITTGLGLPVETTAGDVVVVTLLSALGTPIARRFEIWNAIGGSGEDSGSFELVDGVCEIEGPLWEKERKVAPWEGPIGQVAGSQAPLAQGRDGVAGLPSGYRAVVAAPIFRKGRLAQIAAWYF